MGVKLQLKVFILVTLIILLVSCSKEQGYNESQIANPSATKCIEEGFTYEIRNNPDGSQTGYCIVNGIECDGWDYYRGECP